MKKFLMNEQEVAYALGLPLKVFRYMHIERRIGIQPCLLNTCEKTGYTSVLFNSLEVENYVEACIKHNRKQPLGCSRLLNEEEWENEQMQAVLKSEDK